VEDRLAGVDGIASAWVTGRAISRKDLLPGLVFFRASNGPSCVGQLAAKISEDRYRAQAEKVDRQHFQGGGPVHAPQENGQAQKSREDRGCTQLDLDGQDPGPPVEVLPVHDAQNHGGEDPYEGEDDAVAGRQNKLAAAKNEGEHCENKSAHHQTDGHVHFRGVDGMVVTQPIQNIVEGIDDGHFFSFAGSSPTLSLGLLGRKKMPVQTPLEHQPCKQVEGVVVGCIPPEPVVVRVRAVELVVNGVLKGELVFFLKNP
jgi:hypothetical protein